MLSTVDTLLIHLFQWIVRQIELYTEVTRKNIIDFGLKLIKYSLILFFVLLMTNWSQGEITGFLCFINFLYYCVSYFDIKKITGEIIPSNTLPKEILTRQINRRVVMLLIPLAFPSFFLFFWIIIQPIENNLDFINFCTTTIFLIVVNLSFYLEYLLCTTSLPPGEKEKMKAEKEMRNLVPIPTR